jgi:hypothetical protein
VLGHFPSPSGPTGGHQLGRGCLGYVGAILQQWQGSAWAPLDFFSKKLEAAQQKSGTSAACCMAPSSAFSVITSYCFGALVCQAAEAASIHL